ncbi:hypothetical protein LCGC14_2556420, partial [marine sediment metagenome]
MSQLTKELIQKYISNPKVILEFGSYDGMDAIRYKNYFSKAFIYVMEADPTMFEKVKKNINNKEEIYIFHYAISNKTGIIDFYESKFIKDISGKKSGDPSFAGSLYRVLDSAIENQDFQVFSEIPIKVPTITIEDFCKQQKITQIDFAKCIKKHDDRKTFFLFDIPWNKGFYDQKFSMFNRKSV